MRLFFAAFLDSESRRSVSAAVRGLGLEGAPAYIPPEKYHMTLVFIGGVSDSVVQAVREIGEAQRLECVSLRFDRWEYWDGARAVVASSPDRPEPLVQLRASLTAGLMHRGVGFDHKPLRPHITVARKIAQAPQLPALSALSWVVRSFSLVSSVTASGGSVYTVVDSWPLLDTAVRR